MKTQSTGANEDQGAGNTKHPSITIVDIGPTSGSLVELIKKVLPESKQTLVTSCTFKNAQEISVNLFDMDLLTTRIDDKQFNLK